jgi:Flp pilus assembly protein TadG
MRRFLPERGSALIETAVVMPLVLALSIGAAEVGFAMVDQMTASNAAREGARVGAAGADSSSAELAILRAVEQAMCSLNHGSLTKVEIYKAAADGTPENASTELNEYQPSGALNCTSSSSTSLTCANGCPWPPSIRSNLVLDLDDIGVRVTYTHTWVTSFVFTGTATWTDSAVMRLEPDTTS